MHLEPCNPPLVDPLFVECFLSLQQTREPDTISHNSLTKDSTISAVPTSLTLENMSGLSFLSPLIKQLTCTELFTSPLPPSLPPSLPATLPPSLPATLPPSLPAAIQPSHTQPTLQSTLHSTLPAPLPPIPPEPLHLAEAPTLPSTSTPKSSRLQPPSPRQIVKSSPTALEPVGFDARRSYVPIQPCPTTSPKQTTSPDGPDPQPGSKRPRPLALERTPDGRIIMTREAIDASRERLRAKRPRLRHEICGENISVLESWYEKYSYLSKEGRRAISEQTGLPVKTVMYWFQNKRRMMKQRTGVDHSTSMARLMKC